MLLITLSHAFVQQLQRKQSHKPSHRETEQRGSSFLGLVHAYLVIMGTVKKKKKNLCQNGPLSTVSEMIYFHLTHNPYNPYLMAIHVHWACACCCKQEDVYSIVYYRQWPDPNVPSQAFNPEPSQTELMQPGKCFTERVCKGLKW